MAEHRGDTSRMAEPHRRAQGQPVRPVHPKDALWAHVEPETSRRLLLAALEAFASRGFHAATTREIGEAAGMSTAAVYVHYKSKQDLLFEISRVGHEAVLQATESALEQAGDDPVDRVRAYIFAFAKWHAENHVLARVIQYELRHLPPRELRSIVAIRARFESLMRAELTAGVASGAFKVTDLDGTALAALSLCIDLARWYQPTRRGSSDAVGELYAGLVLGMLRAEPRQPGC